MLAKYIDYNRWANKKVLGDLNEELWADERIRSLFSHIINAQEIWCKRVLNQMETVPAVWRKLEFNDLNYKLKEIDRLFEKVINGKSASVVYVNTKGKTYTNRVNDILVHVVNHSTHHRAQIRSRLVELGIKATPTDYIVFCRE